MNTGEAGYYTVIATAIPVLLVAYVIGVNEFVQTSLLPRRQKAMRSYTLALVATLRGGGTRQALRGYGGLILGLLYQIFVTLVFVAAIVLPPIGEFSSLHALSVNLASEAAKIWSLTGLIAAGLVVVTPLALRVGRIYFEVPTFGFAVRAALTVYTVMWICSKWERAGLQKPTWAHNDLSMSFTGLQGRAEWHGAESLAALSQAAWPSGLPHLGRIRMLDAKSALVLDTKKGAVYFQMRKIRVAVLAVWEDADQALHACGLA